MTGFEQFTIPERLFSRAEVLTRPSPVPCVPGTYAWYLRDLGVPGSHQVEGFTLLYVGIAPSRVGSKSHLRTRLRQHLKGNASASTLRLTLGVLLAKRLGIVLQQHGRRFHFGLGEKALDSWLGTNARVSWVAMPRPWETEAFIVRALDLPLNIEHNGDHPFAAQLKSARAEARRVARKRAASV